MKRGVDIVNRQDVRLGRAIADWTATHGWPSAVTAAVKIRGDMPVLAALGRAARRLGNTRPPQGRAGTLPAAMVEAAAEGSIDRWALMIDGRTVVIMP